VIASAENSSWSTMNRAGKKSILLWTAKWESPVRVMTVLDSRVNIVLMLKIS
jgi:hypothetical protein